MVLGKEAFFPILHTIGRNTKWAWYQLSPCLFNILGREGGSAFFYVLEIDITQNESARASSCKEDDAPSNDSCSAVIHSKVTSLTYY